ncbi:mechanosensitive ion channel family protein [Novosphingobium colocasiae]|uniref:mechanosensitive ion channel family protein n=1 Tax=Novosphingobium colocasiae TaxID=1256513 RepID=UPI0035AEB5BF
MSVVPSTAPTPAATETVAAVVVQQPVTGADGIKEAVSAKSGAAGDIVDTLDNLALQVGHTRISVWDVSVVVFVLVFAVFSAWTLSRLSSRMLGRMKRLDVTQKLLAEKLASLVIWAICILVGIDVLGIDLTALAVFSGAFGLAIGFGLQKTFGNLIAGIILLMDKSIKPGDVIAITDQAGNSTFGQIRRIGIRAVSLTTRDQKEYLIPNENLMVNQVENWSYSSKNVRIQVPIGISYRSDIEKAEELMLEAARSVPRILAAPPPTVWLDSYGESWLLFNVNVWITDPEEGVGNVRSDVLKAAWALFKANGIVVPFPQRDLNLQDNAAFRQLLDAVRGAKSGD